MSVGEYKHSDIFHFLSFEYISRNGIDRLWGMYMLSLANMKVPVVPHLHQQVVFFAFFVLALLVGGKMVSPLILICISLMMLSTFS